jgi:AraC-like DNA-binding protein
MTWRSIWAIRVGLCEVFYQYGQLPIGQYIRLRRLTIAAVSLRLTRQPIAAIAWQLSYDSPQTFSGV